MKTYPENRLTDLLIEFDEMGFSPTTVCPNPEQTAIEWKEQIVNEIKKLQAENAELRARLDKAEKLEAFGTYIKQLEDAEEAIASFYGLGTDAQIVWNKYGTNSPQENAPRARRDNNTADIAVERDKGGAK